MFSFSKNIIKKLVGSLLFILTLTLLFNNSVWVHFHVSNDGTIFVHAHPFASPEKQSQNSPLQTKGHKHSEAEFLILDILFKSVFLLILVFVFSKTLFHCLQSYKILYTSKLINNINIEEVFMRGPPKNSLIVG